MRILLLLFTLVTLDVLPVISISHHARGHSANELSAQGPCMTGFLSMLAFHNPCGNNGGGGRKNNGPPAISDAEKKRRAEAEERDRKDPFKYCPWSAEQCTTATASIGDWTKKCKVVNGICVVTNNINAKCARMTSCEQIAGTYCGWCTDKKIALNGDKKGPFLKGMGHKDFECTDNKNWIWDSKYCPLTVTPKLEAKCAAITKCTDIFSTSCGWCNKEKFSRPGTVVGPAGKGKPCNDWIFEAATCPEVTAQCKAITRCADIRNTMCGWCQTAKQARPGDWYDPIDSKGCGNWIFDSAKCPADQILVNQCAGITTCAQIAGTNCGWCKDQGYARPGNWNKPDTKDPCTGWNFDSAACSSGAVGGAESDCKNIKKCEDIKGTMCGWCKKENKALLGDWGGPKDKKEKCEKWNFDSAKCKN